MSAIDCTGATLHGICSRSHVCCIPDITTGSPPQETHDIITREVFYQLTGNSTRTRALYPYFVKAVNDAGISSKHELAAFTAQVLFETSNMMTSEHTLPPTQSSASLGNTQPDDNLRYKGRGFLPLRGRYMYQLAGNAIQDELLDAPILAAMPSRMFAIAAWLWRNGFKSADGSSPPTGPLSGYANDTKYGFAMLSYSVAQDSGTWAKDRFPYWKNTIKTIGVTCPEEGEGPECNAGGRRGTCKLSSSCLGKKITGGCAGPADMQCCIECQNPVDLIFIIDSSSSVGGNNFKKGMEFVTQLCQKFNVSQSVEHGTRIALIRYSTKAQIMFNFTMHHSTAAVVSAVNSVNFIAGMTRTDLALIMARDQLFGSHSNGVRPPNKGVSRVLVLLTDGKTNGGTERVRAPSQALRNGGVTIFLVGIGSGVKMAELEVMASNPDKEHVFLVKSYQSIGRIQHAVQHASCHEPAVLDTGQSFTLKVESRATKFFRYRTTGLEEMSVLSITEHVGTIQEHLSLQHKHPSSKEHHVCAANNTSPDSELVQLRELVNTTFCSRHFNGGIHVVRLSIWSGSKIVCIKMCNSSNVFMSIEGLSPVNEFNVSLVNISDSNINVTDLLLLYQTKNTPLLLAANTTYTFPLKTQVYVGCVVAVTGTMATVAAYAAVTFAGNSLEIKGSSSRPKKKKEVQTKEVKRRGTSLTNGGSAGKSQSTDTTMKPSTNKPTDTAMQPSTNRTEPPRKRTSSLVDSMITALKQRTSSKIELSPKRKISTNVAFTIEETETEGTDSVNKGGNTDPKKSSLRKDIGGNAGGGGDEMGDKVEGAVAVGGAVLSSSTSLTKSRRGVFTNAGSAASSSSRKSGVSSVNRQSRALSNGGSGTSGGTLPQIKESKDITTTASSHRGVLTNGSSGGKTSVKQESRRTISLSNGASGAQGGTTDGDNAKVTKVTEGQRGGGLSNAATGGKSALTSGNRPGNLSNGATGGIQSKPPGGSNTVQSKVRAGSTAAEPTQISVSKDTMQMSKRATLTNGATEAEASSAGSVGRQVMLSNAGTSRADTVKSRTSDNIINTQASNPKNSERRGLLTNGASGATSQNTNTRNVNGSDSGNGDRDGALSNGGTSGISSKTSVVNNGTNSQSTGNTSRDGQQRLKKSGIEEDNNQNGNRTMATKGQKSTLEQRDQVSCCCFMLPLPGALKRKDKEKKKKRFRLTKSKVLSLVFPCFTVFVPEDEVDEEDEEEQPTNWKDRFERDLHMSQAFCILLAQLIFMIGIHARGNMVGCALAAICMNYLYIVAMMWLLIEAYYLYSYTGDSDKHMTQAYRKRMRKYYSIAWGIPLIIVIAMGVKTKNFHKNPHCWVSMTSTTGILVTLPVVTIGVIQLLLLILMLKALITYRKSTDKEEKAMKQEIIKVGVRNILCITLTVLMSWLMATVSVNYDNAYFQSLFAIFNALQGAAFFVFHVLLNPETRQLMISIWTTVMKLKESTNTPFSEHETMEVEKDKDKNKDKQKKDDEKKKNEDVDIDVEMGATSSSGLDVLNGNFEKRALPPINHVSLVSETTGTNQHNIRKERRVPVQQNDTCNLPSVKLKATRSPRSRNRRLTPISQQKSPVQQGKDGKLLLVTNKTAKE